MPAVSVVIPLYNKGPHIARAIQSVLNQTEQSFEIIVVDGQSTDEGPKIVKSFKDQRIFFFEQEGSGVSSARNEGICHSQSDFIAFLDADDEWMPDHLETLLRLRKAYPEAGIYATSYIESFSKNEMRKPRFAEIPPKPWEGILPNYFKSCTYGNAPVCTSAACIPKHILIRIGGFQIGFWWGEDTDLWGRIAFNYPIAFSWNGGVILHRDAENRACNKKEPVLRHPFVLSAIKYLKEDMQSEGHAYYVKDAYYVKEFVAKEKMTQALHNMRAGNRKEAQRILGECETEEFKLRKELFRLLCSLPMPVYSEIVKLKNRLVKVLRHYNRGHPKIS